MIAIIDYDIGNIAAISNMLHRLWVKSKITSRADEVERAEKIILPGNGAFDACALNLRESGLVPILEKKSAEGEDSLIRYLRRSTTASGKQ